MRFKDHNILILGASGGIGSELTDMFLSEGARVILHYHDTQSMPVSFEHQSKLIISADLSHHQGVNKIIHFIKEKKINLSGVIFASGINDFKWLEDQDISLISNIFNVNVISPILLTRAILAILDPNKQAFLAYIGSTMGSIGLPGSSTYCASKFALRGFVQSLRRELGDTKISCLYIAPRATKTKMNNQIMESLNQALGYKMDTPKIVAEAVMKSIIKNRKETYIGWPESIFVRMNGIFPRLLDIFLLKQLKTFKKFAKQI